MADTTLIAWTDATFNPWWGCTKVAPGCDNCYAAAFDKRVGGNHWEASPRKTSDAYWRVPLKWERLAKQEQRQHRVFCGSMCDWTDNRAPEGQLARLWQLIQLTPHLDWQLLTKRAPNILKSLPDDWGTGYPNVWLGVTVEDKKHGLPRLAQLRLIPAQRRFLSIEPLLEHLGPLNLDGIHWVIIGGESGPKARPMQKEWAEDIVKQCEALGVPVFFKQWGGRTKDKGGSLWKGEEMKNFPSIVIQSLNEMSSSA